MACSFAEKNRLDNLRPNDRLRLSSKSRNSEEYLQSKNNIIKDKSNVSKVSNRPNYSVKNKCERKVRIFSDSLGREVGPLLNNLVEKDVDVFSYVKPSTNIESMLGKSGIESAGELNAGDPVVIIGGADDVYANESDPASAGIRNRLCRLTRTRVLFINVPR